MSMPETAYLDESTGTERNVTKFRTLWTTAHEHCGIARLYTQAHNATQSVRRHWNFHKNEPLRDRTGTNPL
jgi:hypothetical protein